MAGGIRPTRGEKVRPMRGSILTKRHALLPTLLPSPQQALPTRSAIRRRTFTSTGTSMLTLTFLGASRAGMPDRLSIRVVGCRATGPDIRESPTWRDMRIWYDSHLWPLTHVGVAVRRGTLGDLLAPLRSLSTASRLTRLMYLLHRWTRSMTLP